MTEKNEYIRLRNRQKPNSDEYDVLDLSESVCLKAFTHEMVKDEQGKVVELVDGFYLDDDGTRQEVHTMRHL